jgi:hypothetical protein
MNGSDSELHGNSKKQPCIQGWSKQGEVPDGVGLELASTESRTEAGVRVGSGSGEKSRLWGEEQSGHVYGK